MRSCYVFPFSKMKENYFEARLTHLVKIKFIYLSEIPKQQSDQWTIESTLFAWILRRQLVIKLCEVFLIINF